MAQQTLSQALKQMRRSDTVVTRPHRQTYRMPTSLRITGLERGKSFDVPRMDTELSVTNLTATSVLGRFESAEQAVLFGWAGVLRTGDVSVADILAVAPRAGFFRRLNESQILHLLATGRVVFAINREEHTLSLSEILDVDADSNFVPAPHLEVEGRKFR